ncbi:MAG: metallophosphoesterase [Patescibacteria group bacterium]|nr:metallophosphoesterase [Patescibacteria group bacterium]
MARMRRIWLITDTHWNHTRLIELGHRPANFEERIRFQWQRLVAPSDIVIHLGDVILGRKAMLPDILSELPGVKMLIRGNHDDESNGWYLSRGFAAVMDGMLMGDVWLTHQPHAVLPVGAVLNVHGHIHDNNVPPLRPYCRLLALEHTQYAPVEMQSFCSKVAAQNLEN